MADVAQKLLQEIREQHAMRLQVEVITTQVNHLAEQVNFTVFLSCMHTAEKLYSCQVCHCILLFWRHTQQC